MKKKRLKWIFFLAWTIEKVYKKSFQRNSITHSMQLETMRTPLPVVCLTSELFCSCARPLGRNSWADRRSEGLNRCAIASWFLLFGRDCSNALEHISICLPAGLIETWNVNSFKPIVSYLQLLFTIFCRKKQNTKIFLPRCHKFINRTMNAIKTEQKLRQRRRRH